MSWGAALIILADAGALFRHTSSRTIVCASFSHFSVSPVVAKILQLHRGSARYRSCWSYSAMRRQRCGGRQ